MFKSAKRGSIIGGEILPIIILIALFAASARADKSYDDIVPTAPVERFRIYGFDKENGWRGWQIEGAKAVFVPNGDIDISGMRLRVYEPSNRQIVNMLIESKTAVLREDRESVSGPDSIVMNSKGIFLGGEDWTWRPDDRKLIIRSHTHAVIEGEIGPILE